jgi:hypothetical protein
MKRMGEKKHGLLSAPCSGYPDAVEERVAQTGSELQV